MYVYISICKCNTHIHLNLGQGRGFEYERRDDRKLASLHVYRRMCICRRMSMHVWMDGCTYYVCMPVWMDGWMDGCLYTCMHTYTHKHTHSHTYMHAYECICACMYTFHRSSQAAQTQSNALGVPIVRQQQFHGEICRQRVTAGTCLACTLGVFMHSRRVPRTNLPPKSHRRCPCTPRVHVR